MKHERYIPCPECSGSDKEEWYNEELGIGESDECEHCHGYGSIENEAYWRAILPNPIPFKEGREAQLEYYNLKNNG